MSKKNLHNNPFDDFQFKKSELKAKGIRKVYLDLINDIMKGFKVVNLDPNKFFAFDDYPQYKNKMSKLFEAFSLNITTEINKQSKESWEYAEKKNADLLKKTMKKFNIKKLELRNSYSKANLEALRAFQNRKEGGLKLSDRVWNLSKQYKGEIELALDSGIRDGKSAAELSKDVRSYLNNPDKLFRKVRDNHGNLGLSKAAKQFHPGQGVYRSSAKNAMRLTRTENNMAYHESNFEKYNDFDFVIGIEIKLSNNSGHCPFCESMQGKYPKGFKFLGWHPHCRCASIPLLKDRSEFLKDNDDIIQGNEPKRSPNEVLNTPKNYNDYIEANRPKLDLMKNKPYWYRDNENLKTLEPVSKIKKVKSEQDKKIIQEKWDNRIAEHTKIKNRSKAISENINEWNVKYLDPSYNFYEEIQKDIKNLLSQNRLSDLRNRYQGYDAQLTKLKTEIMEDWNKTLPGADKYLSEFSPMDIDRALDAGKAKMKYFDEVNLDNQNSFLIKKIKFEIQWLEDKQSYNTWKISQEYFKNNLFKLESEALIKQTDDALEFLQKELKKNPTKKGQEFIKDLMDAKKFAIEKNDTTFLNISLENSNEYIQARKAKLGAPKIPKVKQIEGSFGDDGIQSKDAYTKKRKDEAIYTSDPQKVDDIFRNLTYERWQKMTPEAQKTLWSYTNSSGKINRPLRGFKDSWFDEVGLGKVNFNQEGSSLPSSAKGLDLDKGIKDMAKEIEKHKLTEDIWVRRGTDNASFNGTFGISKQELRDRVANGTLQDLVGKKGVDNGFLSTSPAADSTRGFSGNVDLKIYAPKGTQAIYAEPFSYYGELDNKKSPWTTWKGQKQSSYSSEFEMIINQGYEYEILEIKHSYGDSFEIKLQVLDRKKRFKYY